MELKRLTGPGAGSLKYDILTALMVVGLHRSPGFQVSITRLCVLITSRYNWRNDELSIGQKEIARIWNVNERTVKREMKRLLEARILICKRQGVRGRVGAYRLNLPELFRMSSPVWDAVGPDFADRMSAQNPAQPSKVITVDFTSREANDAQPTTWIAACDRMQVLHPTIYSNWIAALEFISDRNGHYLLRAPSKFSARYIETHYMTIISEAVECEVGPGRRISFEFRK